MGYEDEELDDVQALLQAISIQDMIAQIADFLNRCGFERVQVVELDDLPEHTWEWLGEGWEESAFNEALEEVAESGESPRYWSIETAQGEFGLFMAPILMVDLTGSGVEPFQLDSSLPIESRHKVCVVESPQRLRELRELMEYDREIEALVEEAEADD